MALELLAIFKAVRDQWLGNAALVAVVPDIDFEPAERIRAFPNALFEPNSLGPLDLLAVTPKNLERMLFDISIYDDSRSVATVADAYEKMSTAFHRQTLTFDGVSPEYNTVVMRRLETGRPIARDPHDNWQAVAAWELVVQET